MRWLGLRVRIILALVAATAGGCWALTQATIDWAAGQRNLQLEQIVEDVASQDLNGVAEALTKHPSATTWSDLNAAIGDSRVPTEGVAIRLTSASGDVDLRLAQQFAFVNDRESLAKMPECFQPQQRGILSRLGNDPGSGSTWTEHCSNHVLGFGLVSAVQPGPTHGWLIVRVLSPQDEDDPVPALSGVLILYSLLIVVAAVGVAAVLAAMIARPLSKAREMAEAVAAGDLSVRIPVRGRDEVARMSTAVNSMADRLTTQIEELESSAETQRRFVADVAHELRTPTAALLASAESLGNPDSRDEASAQIAPQLRRLAALTEDLLEISRMDAGQAVVVSDYIDVVDLVGEVIADIGAAAVIELSGPPQLSATVDPARLRVVLRNLLANALQHGSAPISISAIKAGQTVTVSVTDAGAGVPPELRERVFDRFVRGDQSRHDASSGLGLAIAVENARLIGGDLTLQPDGRTFTLRFPS